MFSLSLTYKNSQPTSSVESETFTDLWIERGTTLENTLSPLLFKPRICDERNWTNSLYCWHLKLQHARPGIHNDNSNFRDSLYILKQMPFRAPLHVPVPPNPSQTSSFVFFNWHRWGSIPDSELPRLAQKLQRGEISEKLPGLFIETDIQRPQGKLRYLYDHLLKSHILHM